jgi:methionyl aminopeptidase
MKPLNDEQIKSARICGRKMAEIFAELRPLVTPGKTTKELDLLVEKNILAKGCKVAYHDPKVNFPGSICISVNDEIVHGVPDATVLAKGDVVKFDLVIDYKGVKTDSAFTMVVGEEPTGAKKHLLSATEKALYAGIDAIKAGPVRIGDITYAIEKVLRKGHLGIIRELAGHGIGTAQWQDPDVPNDGLGRGEGPLVPVGYMIAIEPMAVLGKPAIYLDDEDGWTYHMRDGSLGAHFEHTVLITSNGAEIMTKL